MGNTDDTGFAEPCLRTSANRGQTKSKRKISSIAQEGSVRMALSADYQMKLNGLKEKSDKGALNSNDAIYKELDAKAKNLPELRKALENLKINHV
jgi:hypothetical protein